MECRYQYLKNSGFTILELLVALIIGLTSLYFISALVGGLIKGNKGVNSNLDRVSNIHKLNTAIYHDITLNNGRIQTNLVSFGGSTDELMIGTAIYRFKDREITRENDGNIVKLVSGLTKNVEWSINRAGTDGEVLEIDIGDKLRYNTKFTSLSVNSP